MMNKIAIENKLSSIIMLVDKKDVTKVYGAFNLATHQYEYFNITYGSYLGFPVHPYKIMDAYEYFLNNQYEMLDYLDADFLGYDVNIVMSLKELNNILAEYFSL